MSLPAFLLIHTADVQRHDNESEEWETIYEDVPCYIGSITQYPGAQNFVITSLASKEVVMMNPTAIQVIEDEEVEVTLEIKQEDRIVANGKTYRVDKPIDAENMGHHFEIECERVE
jgi:hypothetical protein